MIFNVELNRRLYQINSTSSNTYKDISIKQSIQELKNKVIMTDNDAKSLYNLQLSDLESIANYGLLTAVETVDTNKTNNLNQLAKTRLAELNKTKEDITLTLLADYRVKGKLIDFKNTDYGLSGVYLVKSVTHELTTDEIVSVSVEKQEKV